MRRKVGQANVEEHPKGSGKYRARARIDGKLKYLASGVPEAEAKAAADAFTHLHNEGVIHEGLTLAQFGPDFLDRREKNGVRGIRTERNRWKNHVEKDELSKLALTTITRTDVLEWRDRRTGKRQSRKNQLNLLRAALADALELGIIQANPARDVKIKKIDDDAEDDLRGILLPAEQGRLLKAVPEAHRPLVVFALTTGIRQAEQWWLAPDDITGRVMTIRRSVGGKKPKSGKVRTIPLMEPARLAAEQAPANETYVWPATEGGRRGQGKCPKGWHRWVRDAKIRRRIQWKDLRHTCATSLLAGWWGRKWTIDEVCQQLGHSSVKVTERYARKLQETLTLAANQTEFPASSPMLLPPIANRGKKPGSRLRESNSRPAVYENAAKSNTRTWLGTNGFPVGNSGITLFPTAAWALAYAAETVFDAHATGRRPVTQVIAIEVTGARPRRLA
jgi:integrase